MANPKAMIRSDGTRVIPPRHPSWKTEFYGLWITLITDPWIVLLFPMFFASNWFYTWRAYLTLGFHDRVCDRAHDHSLLAQSSTTTTARCSPSAHALSTT